MKRIATHKKPDADALLAAWLAERYLFAGERSEVIFVPRSANALDRADCVVDITRAYDAQNLTFDHKPPAFADRNYTCAAKLVWNYLVSMGQAVRHLASLVEVVHEGDSKPPRKASSEMAESRSSGLHCVITGTRLENVTDRELYTRVKLWLDDYDAMASATNH